MDKLVLNMNSFKYDSMGSSTHCVLKAGDLLGSSVNQATLAALSTIICVATHYIHRLCEGCHPSTVTDFS